VQEGPPVLLEDDLLAELELLDPRVLAVAAAHPSPDKPRQPRGERMDVRRDLERHSVESRAVRRPSRVGACPEDSS
jgi:hypothetical protein